MSTNDSPRRFEGKVVLVTGGSTGIGFATAMAFAREGARVVIAARRREQGDLAVDAIARAGGNAMFVSADMTEPDSIRAMVDATVAAHGRLDIAFNNAGITGNTSTPIQDASESEFEQVMSVNVRGVWLATKYEFGAMLQSGGGAIVICGSGASVRGGVGRASAYYTSKHALMGLVKQAAIDGAQRNVRVNAVLPGLVLTELTRKGFEHDQAKLQELSSRIPMARPGKPEEIANAVLFLSSAESSYITGVGLSVDGGSTV